MFGADYLGISKLLVLFPSQLRLFLVGIIVYIIFDKINKKNIYPLVLISIGAIILFQDYAYFKFSFYPLFLGVLVIYLVYYVKNIKVSFDFSYSFYILHFPVIQLSLYFGVNPTNPIISFTGFFLVILLLSYSSEKYIEKIFVNIGRKIVKKDKLHVTN
jgi:peptidoglycan/LPS O-acetylase OafA/YrhL